MPTKFLGLDPWAEITRQLERPSRPAVLAAVAYIGRTAPTVLPLRHGDVLVCNASEAARADGATSVEALQVYQQAGVEIRNWPWLHAKVIVSGGTSWIGSANASQRSKTQLYEAVVRSSDRDVVADARAFITLLCDRSELLGDEELRALEGRRPRIGARQFPPSASGKAPLGLPTELTQLDLWAYEYEDFSPEQEATFERSRAEAARIQRLTTGHALIEAIAWQGRAPKQGTWVCWMDHDHVWSPRFVLDALGDPGRRLLWMCQLHRVKQTVPRATFESAAAKLGLRIPAEGGRLRGADLTPLTDLFRR
jgi:hypothetical protein